MIPTWSPIELSLDDEYIQEPILITPRSKAFNIKSKQNEESNSTLSTMMDALTLAPHKKYGLDVVFDRVQAEDILMLFDFNRIKKILTTFFIKSGSSFSSSRNAISDPDALYLRRKYRTIERNHKNTFTELFLSNLVHLLPEDKGGVGGEFRKRSRTSKPWKKPRGKIEFLPDLQKTNVVYSKEDIDQLRRFLRNKSMHQRTSSCTIVEVRAGIFLQNESLLNLADVLKDSGLDFQLCVKSEPYDTLLDLHALSSAMKIVGENRLILDFPKTLHKDLEKLSTQIKTPGARNSNINSNLHKNVANNIDRSDSILPSSGEMQTPYIAQLGCHTNTLSIMLLAISNMFFRCIL